MSGYVIDIDDFCDEVFYKMEQISEAGSGHECYVTAADRTQAAKQIAERLESFIATQLKPIPEDL